jgi:hypothetical protein
MATFPWRIILASENPFLSRCCPERRASQQSRDCFVSPGVCHPRGVPARSIGCIDTTMPGRRTFLVGGGCTAFIKVSCVHSLRLRILTFSRKAESYKEHGRRTSTFFEIQFELNKMLHNRWALRLLPKLSSMPVFQVSNAFRLRQVTIFRQVSTTMPSRQLS